MGKKILIFLSAIYVYGILMSLGSVYGANLAGYDCTNKDISESQCDALVDLYHTTDGSHRTTNTNWLDSSATSGSICSSRYGVNCYGFDGVSSLDLGDNNLVGILPDTIGNLTGLTYLRLEKNLLSGSLPTRFAELTQLQHIYLQQGDYYSVPANQRNQFEGDLFSLLVNMSGLVDLFAPGCLFTGQIPTDIDIRFPNLQNLDLGNNDIDGIIPASIGNLTGMRGLRLTFNRFEGLIPASIGNLVNLSSLDLNTLNYIDSNAIVAQTIPSTFAQLTGLTYLGLTDDNFIGELPDFMSGFQQLSWIELSNNHFTGSLPESWSGMINLQSFRAHDNNLTGSLPESWSILSNLTRFDIAYNNISGPLPQSWSNLSQLQELTLNDNNFQGDIPASWVAFSGTLSDLSLSQNKLGPIIPSWIQSLDSVELKNNCFVTDVSDVGLLSFLQTNDPQRANQNICGDLSITKTVNTGSVSVGEQLIYTIAYQYRGTTPITGAIIRDNLISGLTLVSSSLSYTGYNSTKYGISGDICYDDFANNNTGLYYQALDNFTILSFGLTFYDTALANGYTGIQGGENQWFLQNVCIGNGFPDFQDCMQNVLGIDISTVSSACGKTEYVTDWNIGNISDGSSGSFTIITKIGTTFSSGDIITNSAFTLQDDENNLNNTSTVTTMVIAPSILFPSIGGGGGGFTLTKDACPDGDNSSSYYDGGCGERSPEIKLTVPSDVFDPTASDSTNTTQCTLPDYTMKSFNKLTKLRDKQSFIVCWLYHNQQTIFDNVPEFDYDRVVTREEASRMIGNFVKNILAKEYIRPADDKRCQFVDIADANPGLFDLIYASCRYGIFNGTYHHEFLPKQELNQAHAIATVLRSSYEYQDEQSAIWYAPYVTTLQEKNLLWRGFILPNDMILLESQGMTRGNLGELMYRVAVDLFQQQ